MRGAFNDFLDKNYNIEKRLLTTAAVKIFNRVDLARLWKSPGPSLSENMGNNRKLFVEQTPNGEWSRERIEDRSDRRAVSKFN